MREALYHVAPVTADDLADVRALFRAYAASLSVDLAYQDFEMELAGLPGKYTPPTGALLLARAGGTAVGCVAFRTLEPGIAEMKRFYVSPAARSSGLGRQLALAICVAARAAGFRAIRLDTLPEMVAAQKLYAELGFVAAEPYHDTPVAGTVFLTKALG